MTQFALKVWLIGSPDSADHGAAADREQSVNSQDGIKADARAIVLHVEACLEHGANPLPGLCKFLEYHLSGFGRSSGRGVQQHADAGQLLERDAFRERMEHDA
jgi:hypothetical protein